MIFQNCPKYHELRSGRWYLENFEILRADEQELTTSILRHGIFTDWSIFSTPFFLWNKGSSGLWKRRDRNIVELHAPTHRLLAGIIAKYYVQVMLLFVYNRGREIFGNAQETFLFTVEKTNTGICVRNSLFTSMEEVVKPGKTIQGKQHKQFNESNW